MDVILASHAHQVPHVGFPQIEPVTRAMRLKTSPEGAKLLHIIKKFLILNIKENIDNIPMTENVPSEIQADGTWTYIIRTEFPCT